MSQFQDTTIRQVINKLNQSYFLPDIQREFVWLSKPNENKIEQLFDSILRGYPIGTFLFWNLRKKSIATRRDTDDNSEKLNFQLYKFIEKYDERSKHNEKINLEEINADNLSVVLDGQQRLTSLYIGLRGSRTLRKRGGRRDNPDSFEEKFLFLNLCHIPDNENPEDGYQFEFFRLNDVPEADNENYWFKVSEVLDIKPIRYMRKHQLSETSGEMLDDLHHAICSDSKIAYFAEEEENLDKVLNIFIRVNSGGTQLFYSDLLMSILTATFSSDIRSQMNEFVDALSERGFGVVGRDNVLKTCLLMIESDHRFNLGNFSKGNIKQIEDNWDKIRKSIFAATDMLKKFGYRNQLSSGYVLSVVAYHLFRGGKGTSEDEKHLLKFVRVAQIQGYFRASLDAQLTRIASIVRASKTIAESSGKLFSKGGLLHISEGDIGDMLERRYGDWATLPILQLLYPNLDFNNMFHVDHIYPKSKFYFGSPDLPEDYFGDANALCNLQLLEGEKNLSKGNKDPEEWLQEHYSGDKEKIKAYKVRNYIPAGFDLRWGNIAEFEEVRRGKMLEKLKSIFALA